MKQGRLWRRWWVQLQRRNEQFGGPNGSHKIDLNDLRYTASLQPVRSSKDVLVVVT